VPKYYVIHGSVGVPKQDPKDGTPKENWVAAQAGVGEALELTPAQAAGLVAQGFVADEKTFAGLMKMIEGAASAGATLEKKHQKLANALKLKK